MESLNRGHRKGVTLTQYGHYIFVSRITRQGSLNILRTKIPEAIGYKECLVFNDLKGSAYILLLCFLKNSCDMLTNPAPHEPCFKDLYEVTVRTIGSCLLTTRC